MTPEVYRRVGELFDAALERPQADREEFLGNIGDAELCAALRQLLSHENAIGDSLSANPFAAVPVGPTGLGETIGPYT